MINASVIDSKLLITDDTVSDSVKFETVKFSFPDNWNGYKKTVVFSDDTGKTLSVILTESNELCISDDECYVPHEMLKAPCFHISVFGVLGDSVATTVKATVNVEESGYAQGDEPAEPTPTEYQQLINLSEQTKAIAESVRTDADNGLFKGEQGIQGEKGDKGDPGKIEEGSVWIFDGGDAENEAEIEFVVDEEMSDTSANSVQNKVIKKYIDKTVIDSHPIGSMYYSAGEENPAEIFGGTWEKVRSFYGGELIAYGRIQNTVSNTTAVTVGNVIVISDKCVPEKQYNTVNLIDGIITVDSGAFKIYTQGIAGLVEAQMIVGGRSEADCAGIWWLGNANEIPDGVEMWPNTETNQPLCHIPSNSFGSGMNTYLYHIKDTAAEDTSFFVNPCCKAYAGSFTPCAAGTASALIVKVFAKSGITHSWKRTA